MNLFDCAALDADLILSVLDSGDGKDHKVANVEKWFQDVTKLFPFAEPSSELKATTKVGWLRQALLSGIVRELPSALPIEYAETLVFQYLRYLRFPNITFPKKVLAARLIHFLTKKYGLRSA
jgi:hypothetical protein